MVANSAVAVGRSGGGPWEVPADAPASFDFTSIPDEMCDIAKGQVWRAAGQRPGGNGMQGGADLTVARRAIAAAKRRKDFARAGRIRAVVTGWCWTEKVRFDCGYRTDPICQNCDAGVAEDAFHFFWGCSSHAKSPLPQAQLTNKWTLLAAADHKDNACYWYRGVVPRCWLELGAPIDVVYPHW